MKRRRCRAQVWHVRCCVTVIVLSWRRSGPLWTCTCCPQAILKVSLLFPTNLLGLFGYKLVTQIVADIDHVFILKCFFHLILILSVDGMCGLILLRKLRNILIFLLRLIFFRYLPQMLDLALILSYSLYLNSFSFPVFILKLILNFWI